MLRWITLKLLKDECTNFAKVPTGGSVPHSGVTRVLKHACNIEYRIVTETSTTYEGNLGDSGYLKHRVVLVPYSTLNKRPGVFLTHTWNVDAGIPCSYPAISQARASTEGMRRTRFPTRNDWNPASFKHSGTGPLPCYGERVAGGWKGGGCCEVVLGTRNMDRVSRSYSTLPRYWGQKCDCTSRYPKFGWNSKYPAGY